MLESRTMDHMKSICSWDMLSWKCSGGLHSFMNSSEIFQFCTYARITKCGSHEKLLLGHHSFISFQNYFNFVPMLELRNMDPKYIFSCDFFCEKILVDITVSWHFQNNLNFLPTLQLQLRNVSQLKDNVHETHLFWKYPTYVAVLNFFNYFNFLPMLEWLKLGLLLFRLISSNCQLTKHSSNGS